MSRINRRRFVQTSLAASAAVSFANRESYGQSPSDKLGIAIIGAGGRGGSHVNEFGRNKKTDIRIIVDVDEKAAAKKADIVEKQQGSRPKIVTDMRRVFDDKSVDMISTATPNHWHALTGVWAMQAGKDAYVEKPVSHNIGEGSALVAAAKKYKRICQVGTQCRSNPSVINAIKFMESGGIGEVNFARGLCYKRRKSIGAKGSFAIPDNVDFNLWSGPATYTNPKITRQRFHYDWHWQRHYGNGDSGNQGPHQTDIARWGLGIDTHPYSVISYGGRLGYQAERKDESYVDAGDTANTQVSIYDYGKKCIVFETRGLDGTKSDDTELNTLFQSDRGNKIGVVFYGTEGYVVQKSYGHCVAYDKDMKVIKEFKGGGDHFGNFVEACLSRDPGHLNADVREGHLSAALSHLGNISYYLGEENKVSGKDAAAVLAKIKSNDDNAATLERTLKHLTRNKVDLEKYPISMGPQLQFDPVNEVFPASKEATAMITREYRPGFECPRADKV